jgi:hypothetical protein
MVAAEVFCQPTSSGAVDGYASWPITAAAATAVNVTVTSCTETYTGNPTRTCNPDGTWGAVQRPCTGTCAAAHPRQCHMDTRPPLPYASRGGAGSGLSCFLLGFGAGPERGVAQCQRWHDCAGPVHPGQRLAGHCSANLLGDCSVGRGDHAVCAGPAAVPGDCGLQR